jgi:hypothetical protein
MILFFFVDDITMLCHRSDLPKLYQFRHNLMDRYEMKDLGEISWFLGI